MYLRFDSVKIFRALIYQELRLIPELKSLTRVIDYARSASIAFLGEPILPLVLKNIRKKVP